MHPGDAVAVPFGGGEGTFYTGIIWRLHDTPPAAGKIRTVSRRLYARPLLDAARMRFWEWIADYYMCTLGEVMRFALPAQTKPRAALEADFVRGEYRPRTEVRYFVTAPPDDAALAQLSRRAPAAGRLLERLAVAGGKGVARSDIESVSAAATLVRRGLAYSRETEMAHDAASAAEFALPLLTSAQNAALDSVEKAFATKSAVLLQGVAGSGKTEVYTSLIARTLLRGGSALVLLPEKALTAQLAERLRNVFGQRVEVYHSHLTPRRRADIYMRVLHSDEPMVVVGVRSALFLPLHNLSLVVVDEEHDAGYKQSEPAPRYNARDSAVMLASITGARALLCSATPSLESWLNAATGKYGSVRLRERYGNNPAPEVSVSDNMRSVRRGERRVHFNKELLDAVDATLASGAQTMLLQNRRGFNTMVSCDSCGWTPACRRCNVAMTLHSGRRLVCHYCDRRETLPARCPVCGGALSMQGFGTEKVEEELSRIFPSARILRLDRDTMTSESAYNRIIDDFAAGRGDILVGTQIIAKGFDFDRVATVGILNADNLFHVPDFRATERACQMLMQIAGRAGRRSARGRVVIQTSEPQNPLLYGVVRGDYDFVARTLLAERAEYGYPPYVRMIRVTMRCRDRHLLRAAADMAAASLRKTFEGEVTGPVAPPVDMVRGESILELVLRIGQGVRSSQARNALRAVIAEVFSLPAHRKITVFCNVDP